MSIYLLKILNLQFILNVQVALSTDIKHCYSKGSGSTV